MSKLIRYEDYIINLDQVTYINGNSQASKIFFGKDHWVRFPLSIDYIHNFINNEPTLADESLQKELARVTRDYEELARECDRLKEMVGQLFTANGRLVYANILKERRKGPRRWR